MKPKQRVILYRAGMKKPYDDRQKYKADDPTMVKCPGPCGRYYKDPNRGHYQDFKNKIRCL